MSLHCGEVSLHALSFCRLLLPAGGYCLPLGVELHGALPIEVRGAPHTVLVAREGEHGQRNGNRQVDSDLSGLDLSLELASSMAVPCENRCSVSPTVVVDKSNCTLQSIGTSDQHNWPEDFFIVAFDTRSNIVDDGWANPVTFRIAWHLNTTTVK